MSERAKFILLGLVFLLWLTIAFSIVNTLWWGEALGSLALVQIVMIVITWIIMNIQPLQVTDKFTAAMSSGKDKRDSSDPDTKMRLLLDMMDEDERYAFKEALAHRLLYGASLDEPNDDTDSFMTPIDDQRQHKG